MNAVPSKGNALPTPMHHTVAAVDASYLDREAESGEAERGYLTGSDLSTDCDRQLWYKLRRAPEPERFEALKLRQFESNRQAKVRILVGLSRAGLDVGATDPATDDRWSVEAIGGHFRDYLDALVRKVPEASHPAERHVLMIARLNTRAWKLLEKSGLREGRPGHWRRLQVQMHLDGTDQALYVAEHKDDEKLKVLRVEYDAAEAERLMARLERVRAAAQPPERLFDDPGAKLAFVCLSCPALEQCHRGAWSRPHCRTCLASTPTTDGWTCERHEIGLTDAAQRKGCGAHLFIPQLVPAEQIDADEAAATVTYRLLDGRIWVDGGEPNAAAPEASS